jgi:hypothetical protein
LEYPEYHRGERGQSTDYKLVCLGVQSESDSVIERHRVHHIFAVGNVNLKDNL